jgi:hypothetical protein
VCVCFQGEKKNVELGTKFDVGNIIPGWGAGESVNKEPETRKRPTRLAVNLRVVVVVVVSD